MKIYNYYCVKTLNGWFVLHNWDYEDFKTFPKFGLDTDTYKEACETVENISEELKQRLTDLAASHVA